MRVKIFDSVFEAKAVLSNNDPKLVRVDDKEICVIRKNDHIYAFENSCPHMGERLHLGNTNYLDEIICPLHTYRFSMKTGIETNQRCGDLKLYQILQKENGVFLEY
ncbi:MAG: Rieske (2Fe-2S) protein [Bacteroidota bacterium]